nr:hypothetical protein [uncultured Kingella sp.]
MFNSVKKRIISIGAVLGTTYIVAFEAEFLNKTKPIATSAAKTSVEIIRSGELRKAINGDKAALEAIMGKFNPDTFAQIMTNQNGKNAPENIELSCRPFESAETCLNRNYEKNREVVISQLGLPKQMERLNSFNNAYTDCKNSLNENPNIDLDDPGSTYPATVQCLVDKGFREDLNQMAELSPHLRDVLTQI